MAGEGFASLGLSEPLLRAVDDLSYVSPSPVQLEAIPAILSGRDVWVSARTGSGKTASFVLPLLERFFAQPVAPRGPRTRTRALVIAPTRELAAQIGEAFDTCGRHLAARPKTCVLVGGVSKNPQMLALRGGADIVIATPGRLLDLVSANALHLAGVEVLVLDEADRLLSLGFADELSRVLALLGPRQSLLFSATFPATVRALAADLLREPVRVEIDAGAGLSGPDATVVQRAIAVDTGRRTALLRHLLETHGWAQVLVFVASRHAADHVAEKLRRASVTAAALHGDLSQGSRTNALEDFKEHRVQVLVATDLAGRGLDVVALPAVVNYDLPRSAVEYVHRIGRTARAGEPGVAVSFVTADSEAHFRLIEKRHRLALPRESLAGFEAVEIATPVLDPHGGVKGKRKSKKDKLREAALRKPDLATGRGR
ncbi:MAG: DEAD/DEAH box helicase [Myxococcales bacterium]|nr:DEAD/DEAH box helicase [Myxococcales bacterium]